MQINPELMRVCRASPELMRILRGRSRGPGHATTITALISSHYTDWWPVCTRRRTSAASWHVGTGAWTTPRSGTCSSRPPCSSSWSSTPRSTSPSTCSPGSTSGRRCARCWGSGVGIFNVLGYLCPWHRVWHLILMIMMIPDLKRWRSPGPWSPGWGASRRRRWRERRRWWWRWWRRPGTQTTTTCPSQISRCQWKDEWVSLTEMKIHSTEINFLTTS